MTPAEKVFQMYSEEPERHVYSRLYLHYKRGLEGLSGPRKDQKLERAAWRAGHVKFLSGE
jgi:hypothetical protein